MVHGISSNESLSFKGSLYNRFFEKLPNKEINNSARFNRIGKAVASPHWNRLALGVGAIITQPTIDRLNPRVDKDTAKASSYRTTGKIIACTSVGFCVRGFCYKMTEKYAHASKEDGSILLTPKAILEEKNLEMRANKLKLHKNAFSTIFALCVMIFTNFLLDAPLTTMISNYLISKDKSLNLYQKSLGKVV